MTPKEKAKKLVEAMWFYTRADTRGRRNNAKQCALIAVDEIINCLSQYKGMHDQEWIDADVFYYNEVKKEINNF